MSDGETSDTNSADANGHDAGATHGHGAEPAAHAGTEAAPTAPDASQQRIAELEGEVKTARDRMLRVAADFENYRKRAAREAEDARQRGQQTAVSRLLPVFDNLERATGHADASTDVSSMVDGLRMVMKQFAEAIGKLGIERVDAVGKAFDPTLHESIQYEHHPEIPAGMVALELQAGYRNGEQLLRPALVVVSKGPASAPAPTTASPLTNDGGASHLAEGTGAAAPDARDDEA